MAREVVVRVTDDFDNAVDADTTRILGWEGYNYIIDLSEKNDAELQALLQPYLDAAHEKVKQRKKDIPKTTTPVAAARPTPPKPASSKLTAEKRATIRAWAKEHGIDVGDKGILAKRIVEAYEAEHSDG